MDLPSVTFTGPAIDDEAVLERLPEDLQRLLRDQNGFVAYDGGLHVRGACADPAWHALRTAWDGEGALHRLYPAIESDDVPFAQDAVGDQWLLRAGEVVRLEAETGDVESLRLDLDTFLARAQEDPVEVLGLHPLMQHRDEGGRLEPGQLLNVYPPFCTEEAADGVSLRAVPAEERIRFLADLARQLPAEGSFRFDAS